MYWLTGSRYQLPKATKCIQLTQFFLFSWINEKICIRIISLFSMETLHYDEIHSQHSHCTFNSIAADGLSTQGTMASTAMALSQFARDIAVASPEVLSTKIARHVGPTLAQRGANEVCYRGRIAWGCVMAPRCRKCNVRPSHKLIWTDRLGRGSISDIKSVIV